ncbi:anti-sigma factor [Nitriliruptor alkaliphilus]|uniref:anti-sigma factor n=1 Tax=Nitriliruptor alkaliphilus TaxID=427918 RepID=UPI000697753E|nr:anti-sigma factor [Nitriliruptor alkaliphilus]
MSPDIHTLTGAYAVNALPDDERRAFEAHLAACDACTQEVAELQATAARLGAASAVTPPAGLRDAVMAEIADVRQEAPSRVPSGPELPRISPSRRWMSSVIAPAAAVVVIAILGLSAIVANLSSRIDQIETTTSQVTNVIAAADAQTIEIETRGSEVARLIMSPSRSEAVLLVNGMAAAPEDHNFVIWLIDGEGTAEPAGTFDVDDRGRATRVVAGDLAATAALGVTIEPDGQPVTVPTSDPLMVVEMPTT